MLDLRSWVYAKAILFIVVVSLALLGLDLKQSWTAYNARLQEAATDTNNLARSLAQHAQDVFETIDAELKGMLVTLVDGTGPAAIARLERRMHGLVEDQPLLHGMNLFDEHGNWLASSFAGPMFDKIRNLNYTDRAFFRYHRDHSAPVQAKLDGTWIITLSRRMNHPDGSFAGVVTATIDVELFQRFFETFNIGKEGGAITLATGKGVVMVRRPFDQINVGRNVEQSEFFRKVRDTLDADSFEFTSLIDGTTRLGSFHRVPGFDLLMMVALNKNEVLDAWWKETKVHLVWLVVTIIIVIILGHRIVTQVRDRVAAETAAQKLQLEAEQRRGFEAERRAYERELEQQKLELERSNAALEQFAYAASHDLQSPLRAIAHLAAWIDEDVRATASADTMDNLKLLNGRVARLQMLISGLLAYARIGRTGLVAEEVNCAAAVQDIVALLDLRPNFIVACAGEMSTIRTHRTPFELVLKNLISNALQHHDRAEGHVTVSMRRVDGMAEIRVSDDGPGIEERFHEEIFVIFRTLKSRDETELSGLGLSMVKKQVAENGGRIWVESAPPTRGTTFAFTWKLAAP